MRILLAVDRSEYSARVVEWVASHGWPAGTEAQVLSVIEEEGTTMSAASGTSEATDEPGRQRLRRTADELTTRFANWLCSSGLTASGKTLSGDPSSVILDEARAWDSDLILVGSRGETDLKNPLLGSVARHVVTQAPCSVFVVRHRIQSANNNSETSQVRTNSA